MRLEEEGVYADGAEYIFARGQCLVWHCIAQEGNRAETIDTRCIDRKSVVARQKAVKNTDTLMVLEVILPKRSPIKMEYRYLQSINSTHFI